MNKFKYIGVDGDGTIVTFEHKVIWCKSEKCWVSAQLCGECCLIPADILPPLERCCLYRIDKDYYTLIERAK